MISLAEMKSPSYPQFYLSNDSATSTLSLMAFIPKLFYLLFHFFKETGTFCYELNCVYFILTSGEVHFNI
jgi:hypothetical protein